MWYLKVSSSLYIAVALICMIQNAISLTVDQNAEDQWSKLESSTDQIDLKKILKLCKNSINSFNEKLENTKTTVNKKLPEPNKTTEDIEKLVSDVKTQIKNSSTDLITVRKLVQKTALRFRDTFKSLSSFTELDNETVNKELEVIKKTTVDGKKPLVNRVVRSFGKRYDLNKLANRVLEISDDREKLKNNYDEKKKIAKKELNSLWNSLTNHSKTVNDNALKAFETFFEGMKSLKSVKKKVKTIGEDAINEIKKGNDFNNIKNAVELAKALKLKFEDEWNLDTGELNYSEEQKKDTTQTMDENLVEDNEYDDSTNDIEPSLPTTEQDTIDNEKINAIPSTQIEIEKPSKNDSLTSDKAVSEVEETQLPTESENKVQTTKLQPTIKDDLPDDNISDNKNSPIEETSIIPNTENKENKEKILLVEPKDSNNETNLTDGIKSDLSNNEITFNPDITNDDTLISPNKNAENNKTSKIINKKTSREKIPILPWEKLIQLDDTQVSQQSKKCESLLNNILPDFDNIKKLAKNSIQVTQNYKALQNIENETVQRFYDKMVDTNTKLSDYLVDSAEDVCAKVTPINKRYETKFKNDPNIKRINYLLTKQYDPNQYILKVLDDASHKTGIGGMKKTTYYKMLAVAHNLNHETKEMEDAALYAMNKIYEGKLAATNLQKMFNKEKASKACYIRNILLEKENDAEKKNRDENKEKIKENINNDTNTEPLKPDVNLDSVDDIQPPTINDDNEPILNNEEEKETINDTNEPTTHNNLDDSENDNTKKENEEQKTEENYNISSLPQNKDSDSTTQTTNDGAHKPKRNITRKVTHHRNHRNPNDPNDVSEEYDTIEEIDDEEDVTNEYKSSEDKSNDTPEAESLAHYDNKQEVAEPEHSENKNGEQKTEENYNISSIPQNKDSDSTTQTTNDGAYKPKRNITRKVTHHRNHRNPNDPNDVSEEYDTIEEIDDEEDVTNAYKSSEDKSNDTPEAESLVNSDNKQEVAEPEHSENKNGESNEESNSHEETTQEGEPDEFKTNQRIKRIDPKDGKDISEKYEEEGGNKLNKSGEKTFGDTEKSESPVTTENQDDAEAPGRLQSENAESNEENSTPTDTSEADNLGKPKTKLRRKRKDPKDGKPLSEVNDTFEEDEKILNNSIQKKITDTSEIEPAFNEEINSEQEIEEEDTNTDITSVNEDTTKENLNMESKSFDEKIDQETEDDLNENVNLNSVEDAELKSVNNEKIIRPAESMGEDSRSYESSYTPEYDETSEDHHLHEHEPETPTNEVGAKPSDIGNQDERNNQPKRRHRRQRDPNTGLEVSEEYDTHEEQDEETPTGDLKMDTPSATREYNENEQNSDIPEHDENPEHNEYYEHEPETPTNEVAAKPSDIGEQDERNNQPKRRHRRRRNPNTGLEVSEEYDTHEEQDEETPLEDNKIDTPEYDEPSEDHNLYEHEPEIPTNGVAAKPSDIDEQDEINSQPKRRHRRRRDPNTGLEVSEEYDTHEEQDEETPLEDNKIDTPEYDEPSEDHNLYEHEPEIPTNGVAAKPSDIDDQDERISQPKRRHRRRRDPNTGLEVSEEYDTHEEQDEETPLEDNKIDTPEYDETSEDHNLYEHEPETPTNGVAAKPSDIDERDEINSQPKRRQRRRRDPNTGLEVSEEYDTHEEQDEETPLEDNKIDTPEYDEPSEDHNLYEHEPEIPTNGVAAKPSDIGEQDERNSQPKRRHRRRRDPNTGLEVSEEYDTHEEQDEETPLEDNKIDTPEYDETSEDHNLYEHEPETPTNGVAAKPSDIDEQDDINSQPKRRHRRRRDPNTGLEVSEEYDTHEEQDEETPLEDNKIDTPEYDETSEDHNLYEHEPEIPTNGVEAKPSDIDEQDERNSQPKRRHRRRRDPNTGLEVSEEYDTHEEQDEETPLEDNKIDTPEYDETSEDHHLYEQEPEIPTNEVADKPNEIDEQTEGVNQPYIRNRRQRRPKKPKTGLKEPKDYEVGKQNDESPTGDFEMDTPSATREYNENEQNSDIPEHDENPEHNEYYEHEPETPTNGVAAKPSDIDEQDEINSQPKRRHRRRRDPNTGLEVSEEYDTDEEQDEETPLEDNKIDTPEYDETSEDHNLYEHEPDIPTNEVAAKPSDIGEQDERNNQPKRRHRRRRNPNTGLEVSEEYDTHEEQDEETPLEDNKNDTPEYDETSEDHNLYEHEPEIPTNGVAAKPSDIGEQDERNNQPKRRHRRRRNPNTGLEVSEEYDTDEEQDEETPLEDNKIDTPEYDETSEDHHLYEHEPEIPTNEVAAKPSDIGEQDERNNQPKRRHRRRRDPNTGLEVSEEYDTHEEQDEETPLEDNKIDTPEYDEPSEDHNLYEHEPEIPTNGVAAKPSDIGEQDERNSQPKRRHRRRRDPNTGLEVSEEYDTHEEQDEETPLEDNKIDTPEYDETSEDHNLYEHEPETPTNGVAAKPSDIDEQDDINSQPKRRHRRRRDPNTGLEVSEEYDTHEEQDEETPLEDNKIDTPEYDETSEDHNLYEHEPEIPTNGVEAKPSDIDEQDERNSQPKRRHRRRRDPNTGLEVSEEYDTHEEQDEETPLEDNKIDTPEYDETSEDHNLYEHEPEIPTNGVEAKPSDIDEQDERNSQPKRRHRRRRDPNTGLEVSEEYDTHEEQDEETPLEDNKIDTPEYDETSEDHHLYEQEPEIPTNEVADKPNEIDEQTEGVNQPYIRNRRQRRPKKPKTGLKEPKDYEAGKQNDESPTGDFEMDTPSAKREYNENEQNSDIPEHDENPEHNEYYEHEPETPTNGVAAKPSDIDEQDEINSQPKRRHRRRRDPNTGLEVSEEYDTHEEQDEETPLEDNKIDTPEYDETSEDHNLYEHEPEIPTNEVAAKSSDIGEQDERNIQPKRRHRRRRNPNTGLEVSEEYDTHEEQDEETPLEDNKNDTPEYDETSEDHNLYEHEPEIPTNGVAAKPSDIDEQDERNSQPKRRHRRRRDPNTGLEVSEEYDTHEEQDEETPLEDNKIDTPEYDETSEDHHLYEHEPEIPTNGVAAKPSDIDERDEINSQPKRRHRRRRDPNTGLEVSEEYDTHEEQDEETPLEDNKIDTPEYDEPSEDHNLYEHEPEIPTNEVAAKPSDIGEQDERNNQPKRRHRRRRNPNTGLEVSEEYDTDEEQDEETPLEDNKIDTPEYDETSEDHHLYEHEPEIPTNEVAAKPSDIGEQDERNNQPKRRHRRRRDPNTGLEVSEEYDTHEEQDEETPLEDNKIDTPEYDEPSEDHNLYEHEPEIPTNGVAAKPSDIGEQDERNSQPKRRHRRRRDPNTGLEVSEEYDTHEEQDEETPLEDNKIDTPEYDETSEDHNLYEHEPETPTNGVAAKPSDIDEQDDINSQPKRRHRRRRDPNTGLEVSEEYDTHEEQDEETPLEDNKIDTPEYDETSEDHNLYEHEPEIPTNGVEAKPSDIDEQDERNSQPKRRHRRRRDPNTGLEVSEEYDTHEEQDEETPLEDNKIDTPEYDETSEDHNLYEHEPEIPTNGVEAKPSDIDEQDERNSQPKRRHRRRRDPNTGLEVSEEYDTHEEQDEETPLEDNKIDTPEYDETSEDHHLYEQEPEIPTNGVAAKPSDIDEQDERSSQPKRRHRRRRDPNTGLEVSEEYDTHEEQDEETPLEDNKIDTPEYDETSEDHNLYEHEPEIPTNEVAAKPSDIGEQDERNSQPKRRHRRRRNPNTGLEVSEEYDTHEEQDEETPLEDNKIDTPEYDEPSEDHNLYEHEPEIPTNGVAAKPSDIGEQDERNNQPKRRHRRRRNPNTGLEVSEEYDTYEEQDEETPLEDNKIDTPEYDETSEDYNLYEHEPEIPTNEVAAKPSDIGEQYERNNQPKRRHRRRRNPNTGLEVSEEYDTHEEQDEETPLEDNKIDTPEYDETSEHNELNDVDNNNQPEVSEYPELSALSSKDSSTPTEADENGNIVRPNPRKIRHRRKSKKPQSFNGIDRTPIEVNNEDINNNPVEDQDVNNHDIPYNDDDVLEEDPHHGYGERIDENQPELSEYPELSALSSKDSSTPTEADENGNIVRPNPRKIRRRRKSKKPQSFNGIDRTPIEVNNEDINNNPVEDQDVNNHDIPYNDDDVLEEDPHHGYGERIDENQPELSEYPELSALSSKDSSTPTEADENGNIVRPNPRKIRRRRKSKKPQSFNGIDRTPIVVNNEDINNNPVDGQDVNNNDIPYNNDDVLEEDPHNGYGERIDENQPELSEYPKNSDLLSEDSTTPTDTDDNGSVVRPNRRKIRRRRKSKKPQSFNEINRTPIEVNNKDINNNPVEGHDVNNNAIPYKNDDVLEEDPHNGYGERIDENQPDLSEYPKNSDLLSEDSTTPTDTDDNGSVVRPNPRKIRRRRKSKKPQSFNGNDKTPIETNDVSTKTNPTNIDAENSRVPNEEKSTETPEIDPNNIQKNPNKKRRIRRIIRTYVVNKATNERIPIIDQTYSTTDGFPDDINNKLESLESDDSNVNDSDANTDNDDYSSFLFKEYNSDQCKRDAYDRFKKVTSQDAKQIAYRSVLDTSEMRSNMLATLKNAISNVKASRTFNDVDQSLRTVSYSLKVGLKQTVSDLVIKVIPLAKDFLKTAENLKELYQRGPQSTHKMLTNILENESTVPESAKDILRLISPQFDVDELINNIFEKPCTAKSLKEKKIKAQRKLIDLSKNMDTAISNIDCFVLSAMSTVGIGADTLKLLKSGKVIMSDKHPRAKILRDAVGIIKAGKKIRNNDDSFTPTLTPSDGTTKSDEDDDDEDPDEVAQKNEEFLKTVPDLDDNIPIPKKVPNKRQPLGVIVVHPDKQIEYKEVTDTSQLKKFVGDQTKKYKLQSKNKHPKFLKLNSKRLIDAMVADVKKKAERNGMTKKEMVDEIIKNLSNS